MCGGLGKPIRKQCFGFEPNFIYFFLLKKKYSDCYVTEAKMDMIAGETD